jgi:hypothetical protein
MLVDPRHQIGDADEVFGSAGCVQRDAQIEVFEPDLLPRTTERDALGCFAVNLCQGLAERGFKISTARSRPN